MDMKNRNPYGQVFKACKNHIHSEIIMNYDGIISIKEEEPLLTRFELLDFEK